MSEPRVIDLARSRAHTTASTGRLPALAIAWTIGSATPPTQRSDNGKAHTARALLEWRIDGDRAVAALTRAPAGGPQVLVRTHVTRIVQDEAAGLDHIEVDGLLWVTLARCEGGRRLLFARTTLLARIGVPGGRAGAPHLR